MTFPNQPNTSPYVILKTDLVLGDTSGTALSGSTGPENKPHKQLQENIDYVWDHTKGKSVSISNNYTAGLEDDIIISNSNSNTVTVTLPTIASSINKTYTIKTLYPCSFRTTIAGAGGTETIDGDIQFDLGANNFYSGTSLFIAGAPWITIRNNGTEWVIISGMEVSPQVKYFYNATHNHSNNATGGLIGGYNQTIYKDVNYTATWTDQIILYDCTTGSKTLTLPAITGSADYGKTFIIKKLDSTTNQLLIQASGSPTQTIERVGITNYSLTTQDEYIVLTAIYDPNYGVTSHWAITGGFTRYPHIVDFTNSNHNHSSTTTGGAIGGSSISGILGAYTNPSYSPQGGVNYIYQAATDGIVMFSVLSSTGGGNTIYGLVNSVQSSLYSPSPNGAPVASSIIARQSIYSAGQTMSITFAVKKNYYWSAYVDLANTNTVYLTWVPIGV